MTEQQLTLELIPPRPAPAPAGGNLPPAKDLGELIREEHRRAELLRLRAGFDGCGCGLCQELYRELDLSQYGGRVIESAGIILIKEKSHQDTDHWTADGAAFVSYGEKYGIGKSGATFRFVDKKDAATPLEAPLSVVDDEARVVTKLGGGNFLPPTAISEPKNLGRPKKSGEVTRMTKWRRNKEQQG